ncbi:MAG: transcription termination/antitermination protein NusG [Planctomycetota bacterium]
MALEWFALRVRVGQEDQIKASIESRFRSSGKEESLGRLFIPTEKVSDVRDGKSRVVKRKVFPGYIYIKVEMTEENRLLIVETPGVSGFVSTQPYQPESIPQEEMQKLLSAYDRTDDSVRPRIEFEVGEVVKIKEGPFENYEAAVEEVFPSRGVIRVSVNIFGRTAPLELEVWQVEKV